jgi:ATP-binding cassette subfamily B protein
MLIPVLVFVSPANKASSPRIAFAHLWENHKNMPESPTKLSSQRPGKLKITRLIRPHWKALTLAFIAVLGETFSDVLEPWPIKIVIDNILQSKALPGWMGRLVTGTFGHDKVAILNFAVAAVAIIALVGAVSSYIEKYLTTSVSQWVTHDLRRTLYNHIQRLSLAEHDQAQTGDLITRVTSDIGAVQDFISSALLGMLVNVLTLIGMIAVMLYINWRFTLIALSIAPALFMVVYSFTRRIKKASRAVRKKESELVSVVQEVLTSVRVVKAFAREDFEVNRFESHSLDNVETALKARSIKARLSPIVDVMVAIGTCLVLGYGARLALSGQLSAGVLIVFLLYLGKMYKPMRELSKIADTVSKAIVGYERIQEVLEIEARVRDLPRARRAPRFKGKIEFDHLNFAYDEKSRVLKDISFKIEPGQVAAIVGPSGTGKTTIISLIPRFYDPQSGTVKIDGVNIRDYTLKSLREQISFVLQETLLFHATVWDNIAYGKPDATSEQIMRAAKLANAHEFIEKLPEGYATMIGERGANLSGGQRQRISIARAVIRNTPILILDEPTSGLDSSSEQTVIEALDRLMQGKTSIVIAHHLNSIRHADIIFVIKDSELVEQGTHEELLAADGLYAELHKIQNSESPGKLAEQSAAS